MPPRPCVVLPSRIRLNSSDLRKLRRIAVRPESSAFQALSAKVLLQTALSQTDQQIAEALSTSAELVLAIVQRFARSRFVSFEYELKVIPPMVAPDVTLTAIRIRLTGTEERQLKRIAKAQTSEQRMALRANIILQASLGLDNCEIARLLRCPCPAEIGSTLEPKFPHTSTPPR